MVQNHYDGAGPSGAVPQPTHQPPHSYVGRLADSPFASGIRDLPSNAGGYQNQQQSATFSGQLPSIEQWTTQSDPTQFPSSYPQQEQHAAGYHPVLKPAAMGPPQSAQVPLHHWATSGMLDSSSQDLMLRPSLA